MAVTIRDLAEYCQLSISSVSKALNDYADVSAETRDRVRAAAKALGYHPSAIARGLKTGRSYNLGVLYSDETQSGFTHSYFSPILQAFKEEAEQHGYDITFVSHGNNGMDYLERCRFRGVDGICIVCSRYDDPNVVKLINGPLPVLTIDYLFNNRSCIQSENRQGMEMLVHYVLSRGHQRIAYITGDPGAVTETRLTAFRRAMAAAGKAVPPDYLPVSAYHNPTAARQATRKLLALPVRPTCILMPDDYAALGGMDAIRAAGLRIPEDISIAGFDGVPLLQMCKPKLTSVPQNTQSIGSLAASKLIAQIEMPETTYPEILTVPCQLIEGATVAALA